MYATKVKVQVSFNTFTGADRTPENINRVMDSINYNDWKGLTYIDRGLDVANRELFIVANGMRADKKKVSSLHLIAVSVRSYIVAACDLYEPNN